MRVIGIDLGMRWIGIALSDETGTIATPLAVAEGVEKALCLLRKIIADDGGERIVLGLPRNMDGTLGPKAKEALRFADLLRDRLGVPVEVWDERLTTVEAERYLREADVPPRRWKERVNQVAAQILLQSFLDARGLADHPDGPDSSGEDEAPGPEA